MITVYPVEPVSAPRQVLRDSFKPSPHVVRYRAYRDLLRLMKCSVPQPFHHVVFILEMSKSWSARKQRAHEGMPHQLKPDRDNLEKAFLDSVFGEDQHIWDGRATKLWGQRGLVLVSTEALSIALPYDLEPIYKAVARMGDRPFLYVPAVPI